jgi:DNA polymerase-3 subunit gamma/tau
MPYVSLYRKYRPQFFRDVIGQEHVVQTLQNALRSGRIANGYLFCGTRGVAKTTLARIFAKSLNCIGVDGSLTAPTAEPCGECVPCKSIAAGQCVDVIELDAASNRSVSDMARIRENVQFGPMENRFKTFIVDEAHQLSSDAKDAFLKTLEEPPSNVVFILATTESHAIPITIASRCQSFDFKRGTVATISQQLQRVAGFEGVVIDPGAVGAVARAAEGSYRDALSIFEQVLSYKRDGVTAADVASILGAVDEVMAADVIDAAANCDAARAFAIAAQIFTEGKDARNFFKTIEARVRDMLYLSVGAAVDNGALNSDAASLSEQAKLFTPAKLLHMLEALTDAEKETKFVTQHRLLIEMTLLKLMDLPGAPAVQPVVQSVPAVEAVPHSPRTRTASPPEAKPQPTSDQEARLAHSDRLTASTPPPPHPAFRRTESPKITESPAPPAPIVPHPAIEQKQDLDVIAYLKENWEQVVNRTQNQSPGGAKLVASAVPHSVNGNTIVLGFKDEAYLKMMESPKRTKFIEEILDKVLKMPAGSHSLRCILIDKTPPPAPAPPPVVYTQGELRDSGETPLIEDVISLFGGSIRDDNE